ncbi:O-Antigen ligase [Planctomycetes bacterium Pla163]|uniref:O-Antigen ligase n=1 Tax=Rohdeia mirabilis TaxID=2528008 RepID=A0A518D287_9BACT|nr:O-Antigen ligase [Planctomycetes bacterium Pla163]
MPPATTPTAAPTSADRSLGAQLLPWLLVLPIALLGLPFESWLSRFDPEPTLTATALVALVMWPVALATFGARPKRPWHVAALAIPIVVALSTLLGTDRVEGLRATIQSGVLALGFLGATHLDRKGRRALCRGLVLVTLLFLVPGLFRSIAEGPLALAGPLGNVGPTNQVALAGAAVGVWMVTLRRGSWRFLGGAAALAFALHAVLAPVLAGGLALVVCLGLSATVSPFAQDLRRARAVLAGTAGALLFAVIAVGFAHRGGDGDVEAVHATSNAAAVEQQESDAAPATTEGDSNAATDEEHGLEVSSAMPDHLGGARVRWLIWQTLPTMVAEGGPLGAGAGQFAAAYPPYRDPLERRASTWGTQLEHPHNDWLLVWAEYGWLGGLLATVLLIWVAWRAFTGLLSNEVASSALGAALIALLVNAGAHSVLLYNPASGLIAAVLCGACSGARGPNHVGLPRRVRTSFAVLALAVAIAVPSVPLWKHGRAMADFIERRAPHATSTVDLATLDDLSLAVAHAVETCPEAVLARSIEVQLALEYIAAGIEVERWQRKAAEAIQVRLDARPFSTAALLDRGQVALYARDVVDARAAWRAALEIDPEHPVALANLARLELTHGDVDLCLGLLERLTRLGDFTGSDRREMVRWAVRNGLEPDRAAIALGLDPDHPTAIYDEGERRDDELAKGIAHHLWGRQHMDRDDIQAAVRSFKQAVVAYGRDGIDAPLAILESASAQWLDGDSVRAREALATLPVVSVTAPAFMVHRRLAEAARQIAH